MSSRRTQGHRGSERVAFRQKIDTDIAAGRLPADTDAAALATYYAAVLQGMSVQAGDGAGREDLERIATLAMAAWPAAGT